ncbi:MAG: DUF4974 domain-containing protein [Prevotella sp.]|nr:DUF4974 domain-containing protein [Prevotella sp.]
MNKNPQEKLDFVLHHYRENLFSPEKALRRIQPPQTRPNVVRWVAVAASLLCLAVFAGVLFWQRTPQQPAGGKPAVTEVVSAPAAEVAVFHFDDAPLSEVLDELDRYYGVSLTASDTTRHLTGDFSGQQLDEIIGMIEEVLDVKISQNGK